jgi:prevent-host-death family protein
MPIIKPISDLRNKASEISELVRGSKEPVFITKNGEGDMVVMSLAHYARLQTKIELLTKLGVAQSQLGSGEKGRALRQVMSGIRKKLRER